MTPNNQQYPDLKKYITYDQKCGMYLVFQLSHYIILLYYELLSFGLINSPVYLSLTGLSETQSFCPGY